MKKNGKTILILAAHPDDEVLGCGGTIARHNAEGDSVYLVLLTNGVGSRKGANRGKIKSRKKALAKASKILGIKKIYSFNLPDNKLDSVPLLKIVKIIEPIIKLIKPSLIYTHHFGDLNVDHQRTQAAALTACRPQPNFSVKEIYGFEVLSSTEWSTVQKDSFAPNCFVDISEYLSIKLKALQAYREELRSAPHTRSLQHAEALARHRGNTVGLKASEAFFIYRLLK